MDWATTGKVKGWQIVQPAVAVPRPAGDGTVDDRRPEEAENQGREDVSSFKSTTNNDHHLEE